MSEILYHPEVFTPDWFEMPVERAVLKYSKHALYACNNDRYGAIPVFETIPLSRFTLVELGVRKAKLNQLGIPAHPHKVSKIVVRGTFDATRDSTFVLVPRGGSYFVKTCWFNLRSDKHTTLRRERYATT